MDLKYLLVVATPGLWNNSERAFGMLSDKTKTTCPKCNHIFDIVDNHRTHQIKDKYAPFWFFDAMRQFEHFNEVKCPSCGYGYKAKEARLFFLFRSPYTVVIFSLLFLILAIIFVLKLS